MNITWHDQQEVWSEDTTNAILAIVMMVGRAKKVCHLLQPTLVYLLAAATYVGFKLLSDGNLSTPLVLPRLNQHIMSRRTHTKWSGRGQEKAEQGG